MTHTDVGNDFSRFRNEFHIGQLVEGVVVAHRPFGVLVDIGNPRFPGAALLPELDDCLPGTIPEFPDIGSHVTGALTGFSGTQARLTLRPSRVRAAIRVSRIESLPKSERFGLLRNALHDRDGSVSQAAAWHAWILSGRERYAFLREAVDDDNPNVAIAAVPQARDLRAPERWALLEEALEHEDSSVAQAALREAEQLTDIVYKRRFLDHAQGHASPDIRNRARRLAN
ncbi:MAG: hypothetical protein JO352_35800 [Chloroflexi bacterium]|nr:hypothetical protein [Acidobacteriota bacterium]MBV9329102.1 hypothetical protein [Chloroflexota bacterium]